MIETWKPCFGGVYAVSDLGRAKRITGGRGTRAGKILRVKSAGGGYRCITVTLGGVCRTVSLHVLVAELFIGPRPVGLDVNHRDCDKTNNRATNLEYITRSENIRHSFRMGMRPSRRKLTDAQESEILRRRKNGERLASIARDYGVGISMVCTLSKHGRKVAA